jgi:hypothetical protein
MFFDIYSDSSGIQLQVKYVFLVFFQLHFIC